MATAAGVISNGIDPSKLWSNLSQGRGDLDYLKSTASNLVDYVTTQISYLKQITPKNIIGRAKALWENLSKGNWGFFKNWVTSKETPAIGKGAGAIAGVGAVILGGYAAGKAALLAGGKIAAVKFWQLAIAGGLGQLWFTREQLLEKAFNFFETALETDFNKSTAKFIQESIKRVKELLKSITKDLLSVSGRTLARVVVDQVGKPYLEVDRRTLGVLTLTMSREVMDDIRSTLADISGQLWNLAKDVASQGILYLGRDILADWGFIPQPNDKEEFTLSDYIEKSAKTIGDSKNIPDWLQEAFMEAGGSTYDAFKDGLINRGGIIDERRMALRYSV